MTVSAEWRFGISYAPELFPTDRCSGMFAVVHDPVAENSLHFGVVANVDFLPSRRDIDFFIRPSVLVCFSGPEDKARGGCAPHSESGTQGSIGLHLPISVSSVQLISGAGTGRFFAPKSFSQLTLFTRDIPRAGGAGTGSLTGGSTKSSSSGVRDGEYS